ncbi:MAG: ABC transporter ATP-binding protein [Candidatus Cohnella colombiensis]|uniref:ABC transporter ATP-binding protein n=1 Tax=Candidatus Cohnella colombiensis TaxID=3121368 RepID=A0AA95JC25_9BACL|nr:MAG: ABC transporter ATP-binding protein [Cohnella sp.]
MIEHHRFSYELSNIRVNAHSSFSTTNALRLQIEKMTINAGDWIYMVGVNGSGKSTLARLLAGLYIEGADGYIDRGFAGELTSPIVLQQADAQLFGETPREEVQFALEWLRVSAARLPEMIELALERTGLLHLADEPWERLSGGQRQLAVIAAATAGEGATPFLVLDEATAMLDEHHRGRVMEVVEQLHRQGTTVVWVTQRLDELVPDRRVVALSDGQIVYDGETRDFLFGDRMLELSPCERSGIRMPYLASMAIQLRRQGQLEDPLPVTLIEWRKVLGDIGVTRQSRESAISETTI